MFLFFFSWLLLVESNLIFFFHCNFDGSNVLQERKNSKLNATKDKTRWTRSLHKRNDIDDTDQSTNFTERRHCANCAQSVIETSFRNSSFDFSKFATRESPLCPIYVERFIQSQERVNDTDVEHRVNFESSFASERLFSFSWRRTRIVRE